MLKENKVKIIIIISWLFFSSLIYPNIIKAEGLEIKVILKDNKFTPTEIKIPAGMKAKLIITNNDPAAEEFESIELNREKMIKPGQTVTIILPKLKPGRYKFFGEFHPETTKGEIIVE